ncbi:unnamed protein product [Mycena citricolor]|uniref:Uncharacterized protein n=1 Tax=Mycena citricolor TaxID=2018698 RepID=A0AAD2HMW7_9AGAR|nr:unnamed protein product [Mycena citricolor]
MLRRLAFHVKTRASQQSLTRRNYASTSIPPSRKIQRTFGIAVGVVVTLGVSALVIDKCTHAWLEYDLDRQKKRMQEPDIREYGWDLEAERWTGDPTQGGTDSGLPSAGREAVRTAWFSYHRPANYSSSDVSPADGPNVVDSLIMRTESCLRGAIAIAEDPNVISHLHPSTLPDLILRRASVLERLGPERLDEARVQYGEMFWNVMGGRGLEGARIAVKLGDLSRRIGDGDEAVAWWARAIRLSETDGVYSNTGTTSVIVPESPGSSPAAQRSMLSALLSASAYYASTRQLKQARKVTEDTLHLFEPLQSSEGKPRPPHMLHVLFVRQRSAVLSTHLGEILWAQKAPAEQYERRLLASVLGSEEVAFHLVGMTFKGADELTQASPLQVQKRPILGAYSSHPALKKPAETLLQDAQRSAAATLNILGELVEREGPDRHHIALAYYTKALCWLGQPTSADGENWERMDFVLREEWMPILNNYERLVQALVAKRRSTLDLSVEKKYTYWLSKASWAGGRIIQEQWSPQATALHDLLILTFSDGEGKLADLPALKTKAGVAESDFEDLLQYTSQTLSNLVNFKTFGSTKIVPRLAAEKFEAVVTASANASALPLWNSLKDHIYSLSPESSLFIGKPSEGQISNYYLGETITDEEVANIQAAAEKIEVDILNTRIQKDSATSFTLLVASSQLKPEQTVDLGDGAQLTVKYGDMQKYLAEVVVSLKEAKKYARNEQQTKMIEGYIKSFETGSIQDHKDGSRHWVKDVGPVVESYIGFVETYVDPYGGRAEWEGFTAIVNKQLSAKYEKLVDRAPHLIQDLPWGKDFEVDVFRKPDFTALEVVSFATGGEPVHCLSESRLNRAQVFPPIPNYYEIRESAGFKNVSLANILAAKAPGEELTFIHPDDENTDGTKNFAADQIVNPLTGQPISTWYRPGQTADSVLGEVSSSMEECRAEAVALYLASNLEILEIFKYSETQDIENIQYISFLLMARAGIRALEFYDPATKKHGQAHMQARLGIMQHLLKSGLVTIEEVRKDGVLENLYVKVDRSRVLSEGKSVMGKLLVELQVRKSTADGASARDFYTQLTTPLDTFTAEVRNLVLKKKLPRKIFVQPTLHIDGQGEIQLKEYPLTTAGVIESWIERKL